MERKVRGEKLGGMRQRNLSLVFFFDFQAAESCIAGWGGDMASGLVVPLGASLAHMPLSVAFTVSLPKHQTLSPCLVTLK